MKKTILLILFAYSIILVSCSKDNIIGVNVLTNNNGLNTTFTDTITIISYAIREDSLRTDTLFSQHLLGNYNDPVFGKSHAGIYTQVLLPSNNINLGNSLKLDSVVLTLDYAGFYGDTSIQQNILVYELTEDLYVQSEYYSSKSFTHDLVAIGNKQVLPNLTDSVLVNGKSKAPHLRIPLDASFGNKLLSQSGTGNFADNTSLLNFFKGLYITTDTTQIGGGIMYLNLASSLSKLTLYYSNSSDDSLSFDFLINSNTAIVNNYNHNYSASAIKNKINTPDTSFGEDSLFIQSMAGVKAKLDFPYLKNLGKIAINKAELVLTVIDDGFASTYPLPEQLACVRSDVNGENDFNIPDLLDGISYYGGTKLSELDTNSMLVYRYRFNLARHFQQIINGEATDYGLYLLTSPSAIIADRVIIGGNSHPEYAIKLNLTYSPVNF